MPDPPRSGRLVIDYDTDTVEVHGPSGVVFHQLDAPEAFAAVSDAWLQAGWDTKYVYSFSWLGRPIIQLPEDIVRLQELIWETAPDVIVETGVAHGGSLVLSAGVCAARGKGRVIGVDVEIRPHNREAIESHPLARLITLIEGSSTDPDVVFQVEEAIGPDDTVLVILDSNHTKDHVAAELSAYAPLVTPGSYVVTMDGVMEQVVGGPRTEPDWSWNNPRQAVLDFADAHDEFVINAPAFPFNEGAVHDRVTYAPDGILRRLDPSTDA